MPTGVYLGDTLDQTLDTRTRSIINDHNYGVNGRGVSVLFQWFRRDFVNDAGSIETFIRRYLADSDTAFDVERPLQFDWSVR